MFRDKLLLAAGLVLSAVVVMPQPARPTGLCGGTLFSRQPGKPCPTGSRPGAFFNLFSQQTRNTDNPPQMTHVSIQSSNKTLSSGGPSAPALLEARCDRASGSFVSVVFPGYPMFTGNTRLPVRMVSQNHREFAFDATPGQELFEVRLSDRAALRSMMDFLVREKIASVSVISSDQDGVSVRADFPLAQHFDSLRNYARKCL